VNHPNLLVPIGAPIEPGALDRRDGTPIYYSPNAGAPVWEQPPGMDANTILLYQAIGREMDGRSGLEDAQQLNNPNITSGKQANAVVEQSLTIVSPLNAHAKKAAARAFRIVLQLLRAFATKPQLLRYTGEDGRYLVKEFTGADLGSARDVRIAAGTSTMLSQSAKMQLAQQDFQMAAGFDPEGAYRRYRQAPPWVRLALAAAYDKARRDAGQAFMTVAEMQAAQQQQQQAQALAQQQQAEARAQQSRETTQATLAAKRQEGDASRAAAQQRVETQAAARNGAPANGQMAGVI
jgi:hypothetical protein